LAVAEYHRLERGLNRSLQCQKARPISDDEDLAVVRVLVVDVQQRFV